MILIFRIRFVNVMDNPIGVPRGVFSIAVARMMKSGNMEVTNVCIMSFGQVVEF